MGTFSHNQELDQRDLMRLAKTPPVPSRDCEGSRWNGYATPPAWEKCRNSALQFVPEVAYCVHHLPVEWTVVANERKLLWARLLEDMWREVIDQYPGPT